MKNWLADGDIITLTAPAGGVLSGVLTLFGDIIGCPLSPASGGQPVPVAVTGVVRVSKVNPWTALGGTAVYWDSSTGLVGPSGILIGVLAAEAIPGPLADVRLNGSSLPAYPHTGETMNTVQGALASTEAVASDWDQGLPVVVGRIAGIQPGVTPILTSTFWVYRIQPAVTSTDLQNLVPTPAGARGLYCKREFLHPDSQSGSITEFLPRTAEVTIRQLRPTRDYIVYPRHLSVGKEITWTASY